MAPFSVIGVVLLGLGGYVLVTLLLSARRARRTPGGAPLRIGVRPVSDPRRAGAAGLVALIVAVLGVVLIVLPHRQLELRVTGHYTDHGSKGTTYYHVETDHGTFDASGTEYGQLTVGESYDCSVVDFLGWQQIDSCA